MPRVAAHTKGDQVGRKFWDGKWEMSSSEKKTQKKDMGKRGLFLTWIQTIKGQDDANPLVENNQADMVYKEQPHLKEKYGIG